MRRTRPTIVLATVAALALSGCGSDDGPPTDDRADEQVDAEGDATDADDQDGVGGGADGDTDAGDDDAADDDGGEASPLGEVTIDQTQSFPNGVELTVRSLRVEQDAIFVDIEAFNGFQRDIMLAMFDRAAVIDDTGTWYRYEPPEDNPDLEIDRPAPPQLLTPTIQPAR